MTTDFRKRLERTLEGGGVSSKKKQETISDLRRKLDRIMERRPVGPATDSIETKPPVPSQIAEPIVEPTVDSVDIDRLVPGEFRETPAGSSFVGIRKYRKSHFQGDIPLDALFEADLPTLAAFAGDERLAKISPEKMLFLDTETTGLAGGTGCYAFLVGVGFFTGDEFIVEQFFMRDYSEETAALQAFATRAAGYDALVTFNGKTFDAGLIDTRCTLNRIALTLAGMPHLDLLHPSRRLWKRRFDDCRLGTLEEGVLGLGRVEDIPGSQIPEEYFQYIKSRDARTIAKVFRHNEIDIVSLVVLAAKIAGIVSSGPEGTIAGPHELYSLGRYSAMQGRHEEAARCYRTSLDQSPPHDLKRMILKELSLALKRLGKFAEAVPLWEELLAGSADPFATVELAKFYEHREKDFVKALSLVEGILKFEKILPEAEVEALEHRRKRLERKAGG